MVSKIPCVEKAEKVFKIWFRGVGMPNVMSPSFFVWGKQNGNQVDVQELPRHVSFGPISSLGSFFEEAEKVFMDKI